MTDTLKWMDQYVAESGTPADGLPTFQWIDQTGAHHSSDLLPYEPGFNNATPLNYDSTGGSLLLMPIIGGSRHVKITAPFPESIIEFTIASEAENALNTQVDLPVGTQIAGAPTVSFTYNGIGTARAVYAQLVDNATGRVVGNLVTAVPVTLDGRQHTVELPMENIAYTAYTDSDSLTLQITSSASAYEDFTAFGLINISNVNLDLPTVDRD
jgi:ABC-2 type transport system ATP-binding protein